MVLTETVGTLKLSLDLLLSGRDGPFSSSKVPSVLSKTLFVVYLLLLRLPGVGDCEWFMECFSWRENVNHKKQKIFVFSCSVMFKVVFSGCVVVF